MSAPELDFDELDKAINNVLSDKDVQKEAALLSTNNQPSVASQPNPAQNEPPKVTSSASSSTPPRDRVQGRPSAAPIVTARKPAVHATATPAVRRGVIDIMSPPSKRPSRQGVAVQPVSDVQAPSPQGNTQQPVAPKAAPAPKPQSTIPPEERALRWPPLSDDTKVETKPTAGQVQQESHQAFETHKFVPSGNEESQAPYGEDSFERFDSLSRSGFDFENEKDTASQPPSESHQTTSPTAHDASDQDGQKSAPIPSTASPFISDAKVEKRPLGGYGPAPAVETPPAEKPETTEDSSIAQGMPDDPLLEAHYDNEPPKIVEPAQKPVTAEAIPEDAHTGVKLDHLLDDGSEHQASTQAKAEPQPAASFHAMQSIPQQYKVTEQQNNDKPRPIFDTNEYHAPLPAAPAAKRSGIGMWIVLIVVLLLAVAGGLFIYFYGGELGL